MILLNRYSSLTGVRRSYQAPSLLTMGGYQSVVRRIVPSTGKLAKIDLTFSHFICVLGKYLHCGGLSKVSIL